MATVVAPSVGSASVILGEPPDRTGLPRFLATRKTVERLVEDAALDGSDGTAVATPDPTVVQQTAGQTTAGWHLRPARGASLLSLVADLEGAPAETVYLAGGALPTGLQGRIALAVLRRRAERRGKRLVLLGESAGLHRLAAVAGIEVLRPRMPHPAEPQPVEEDPVEARPRNAGSLPRPVVPPPVPPVALPAGPRVGPRVESPVVPSAQVAGPALVLVLVALVALLLAWTVVPSARVHVVPAAEAWSTPLAIEVDPALKRPDEGAGRLPGRSVSKEIAESATAQASGRRVVPDAPATGQVVFINKTDKPVTVPRGTAVLAGPVRFLTKGDVTVAASVAAGMQRRVGMGRVDVAAAQGGPSGNVDRYQINRTEGPLAASLDVQNDGPTRGGTEKQVAYVTPEDRRRLQETLQRSLTERLLQQVKGQLPAPDKETAVPWAGQNPQVVEAIFSKNAEEEAPTVSLSLKLRYGVTVFGNVAYNAMVRQMVARRLGETRPGYEVVPDSVRPEPPAVVAVDQGIVRLSGQAGATVRPRLDPGDLRGALTNRPAAEAKAYLDNLPGVAAYELQTWPGWLGRLPWLGLRIGISVGPPAPAQSEGAPRRDESTWRSAPNGP